MPRSSRASGLSPKQIERTMRRLERRGGPQAWPIDHRERVEFWKPEYGREVA